MQKSKEFLLGTVAGILNSLLGAGGGIIVVPYLKSKGLDQKSAQASAFPALIIMSAISAVIYINNGYFSPSEVIPFIPFGLLGAFAGARIFRRVSGRMLNLFFSLFLFYSGIKMIMR